MSFNIDLKFYNSRNKKIELFQHDKNIPIHIYTCGPTVYDRVHLGNLKTFLWSDFVVQYLKEIGYKTNHIINITDIDDKIISRLPDQTYESLINYTSIYTNLFLEDISKLGIQNYTKDNIHKVTDNIDSMEQMILDLINKGFAYQTHDGSVYFDFSKSINNPFYLNTNIEGYQSNRNIIKSKDVKSPRDFVLWKVKNDETIKWGNKLPKGRMGWHLECSAIVDTKLDKLHISMGGSDLLMPHHMCSICQSEALKPNQKYGDYWIHFGFLNFNGDKMSKSLGNIKKLEDIDFNYKLLRMYLLTKSYKNNFDYSENEIKLLEKEFIKLHMLYNKLSNNFYITHPKNNYNGNINIYESILITIADNFNTSDAFKLLFEYIDKIMKSYLTDDTAIFILNELNKINKLFNIIDKDLLYISDDIKDYIKQREELRKLKQFDKTDMMRNELNKLYIFEDNHTGYSIIHKLN